MARARQILALQTALRNETSDKLASSQSAHEDQSTLLWHLASLEAHCRYVEQRLREAWRAVLLSGESLLDMDAQYRERQAYLHRAHLLVRIRQSTLIVELIALYAIKIVCGQSHGMRHALTLIR